MSKIVSIHSFRRGAGKSMLTANLAALLAQAGQRVGVVDADMLAPSLHWLLGVNSTDIDYYLNDYLLDRRGIVRIARDVTAQLDPHTQGRLFLVPASDDALQITRMLHEGYDTDLLSDGCQQLISELALDTLLVDTHAGLDQDTLAAMAMSDKLIIMMRPDKHDYQGTAVTLDVARQLEVPDISIVVNLVPAHFDLAEVAREAEHTYQCPIAAVLPVSEEMMIESDSSVFVLNQPQHAITALLQQVAARLNKPT
jgi:MinD-like ATPase involved in chromosome partitioning or flagellar assembly